MNSAIFLLGAAVLVLTNGNGATFSADTPAATSIAQSSARLPFPELPVMTGSQPEIRILTASEQKPIQRYATKTQRWVF